MSHRILTPDQLEDIRKQHQEFVDWQATQKGLSMGQLARKHNASHATIFNVIHGRNYNKPATIHAPDPKPPEQQPTTEQPK